MFGGLALAFLVTTLVEAWLLVQVGSRIGVLPTFALVIAVSLLGAWLVQREGLGVLRRARDQVTSGRVPGRELADGAMILVGGALLITPGFISDLVGLSLLLPPVRAVLRRTLWASLARRVSVRAFGPTAGGAAGRAATSAGRRRGGQPRPAAQPRVLDADSRPADGDEDGLR